MIRARFLRRASSRREFRDAESGRREERNAQERRNGPKKNFALPARYLSPNLLLSIGRISLKDEKRAIRKQSPYVKNREGKGGDCFAVETKVENAPGRFCDAQRNARFYTSGDNNRIGNAKYVARKRDACRLARVRRREGKKKKKKQRARRSRRRRKQRERDRRSPETRRPLGNSVERVSKSSPPSRRRLPRLASDRKSPVVRFSAGRKRERSGTTSTVNTFLKRETNTRTPT